MKPTALTRRSPMIVLLAAVVLASATLLLLRLSGAGAASNLPANKMTATAGSNKVQAPNTTATVMTAQMKTSNPADLIFSVTSECTILSQITNMGTSTSSYQAEVKLWIELDGNAVPVVPPVSTNGASGNGTTSPDDGKVVFCNREFTRTTTFDSNNESIRDIESTEQANAFNWVAMNVGSGVHSIAVKAEFTDTNGTDTFAHGVISKRSLTVDTTNYLISQQP